MDTARHILTIDDDETFSYAIRRVVTRLGHEFHGAATLAEARELCTHTEFDLVLLDVGLPDGNGLDFLPWLKTLESAPEVVIITGAGDAQGAEMAILNGAWDYIEKSAPTKTISLTITRVLQYRQEREKSSQAGNITALKREAIIGASPQITRALDQAARAATCDAHVLITGETGTGKELFASAIHANSDRSHNEMVVVDCAALPEKLAENLLFGHAKGSYTGADDHAQGLIQMAHQSTLFLDEIGELPLPLQKTLLRVLQEKRFRPIGGGREETSDFRLISATNRDVDEMVTRGEFREDLFHRLKTFAIQLPPLRERQEDIKPLAAHYMEKLCNKHGLSPKTLLPETQELLSSYHWPGNVRELVNAVEKAILTEPALPFLYPVFLPDRIRLHRAQKKLGTADTPSQNPLEPVAYAPFPGLEGNPETLPTLKACRDAAVEKLEIAYLGLLMQRTSHDLDRAAEISGLSKNRIYFLLRKYGISKTS